MPCCCVRECKNRSEKNNKGNDGITFHVFPRDCIRMQKWVKAIKKKNWTPSHNTVVCSKHFEPSCFYKTKNEFFRLQNSAVPTLYIPEVKDNSDFDSTIHEAEKLQGEVNFISDQKLVDRFPVLKVPVLDENDPPITKLLASQVLRLQFMCKKQRKVVKNLRRKTKEQQNHFTLLKLDND